jgi:heptosyltransferase-2
VNKALIIQTAFLGDVILATPVVSELKRIYPQLMIDMLVKKGNEELLANHPAINQTYTFNKASGKLRAMLSLIKTFRANRYDIVINLHRFGSSGILTVFSGGKQLRGFDKNPLSFFYHMRKPHQLGDGTHEVERNLSLIADLGAQQLVHPTIYPSLKQVASTEHLIKDTFICLAPASVWFTKQLPVSKWVELIKKQPADQKNYLIGGPSDVNLCEDIKNQVGNSSVINLAGKLSIMESAVLIKHAKRAYVNDSGPLHLASALNTPTTAFFCSTSPKFGFGPLADDALVVENEDPLTCKPCGLHGHKSCPQGHFKCGNDIKV